MADAHDSDRHQWPYVVRELAKDIEKLERQIEKLVHEADRLEGQVRGKAEGSWIWTAILAIALGGVGNALVFWNETNVKFAEIGPRIARLQEFHTADTQPHSYDRLARKVAQLEDEIDRLKSTKK